MKHILITGGAGFIGTNAALYYLKKGWKVTVLDNFSRQGSRENGKYLKKQGKKNIQIVEADIRTDQKILQKVVKNCDVVLHLAGQVAVTKSVKNPRDDFESNALGTLNLLEAVRLSKSNPVFLYSSTNKVYGNLENLKIKKTGTRYEFVDQVFGVSEKQLLDFHSPYGCSKGAADQYVRDYHRIYGLNTVVFRQSCIYGPYQFGIEDQGWVAWFLIALKKHKKITIYGDGKQVRDLLYIDDLLNAYDLAIKNIKKTRGQIYNIGGGIRNTISVWYDFKPILENLYNQKISVDFSEWREGDQRLYVSDIRKAKKDFGWTPQISYNNGIRILYKWIDENIQ